MTLVWGHTMLVWRGVMLQTSVDEDSGGADRIHDEDGGSDAASDIEQRADEESARGQEGHIRCLPYSVFVILGVCHIRREAREGCPQYKLAGPSG